MMAAPAASVYRQQLQQIEHNYSQRIKHVHDSVHSTLLSLLSDPVFHSLSRDKTLSSTHVTAYIREILENELSHEREHYISTLLSQLAELDTQQKLQQHEYQQINTQQEQFKQQIKDLQKQLYDTNARFQSADDKCVDLTQELAVQTHSNTLMSNELANVTCAYEQEKRERVKQEEEGRLLREKIKNLEDMRHLSNKSLEELKTQLTLLTFESQADSQKKSHSFQQQQHELQLKYEQLLKEQELKYHTQIQSITLQSNSDHTNILQGHIDELTSQLSAQKQHYETRYEQLEHLMKQQQHEYNTEIQQLQKAHVDELQALHSQHVASESTLRSEVDREKLKLAHEEQHERLERKEERREMMEFQQRMVREKDELRDACSAQVSQLNQQLRDAQHEYAELQKKQHALNEQLALLQQQHSTAQQQISQQQQTNNDALHTIQLSHKKEKELRLRLDELRKKYESYQQQEYERHDAYENVVRERDNYKEQYINLGEKLELLIANDERQLVAALDREQQKRSQLKEKYNDLKKQHSVKYRELQQEYDTLDKGMIECQSILARYDEKIVELNNTIANLKKHHQDERKKHEQEINNYKQQIDESNSSYKQLSNEFNVKQQELNRLIHGTELEMKVQDKEHMIDSAHKQIEEMKIHKEYEVKINELQHSIEAVKKQYEIKQEKALQNFIVEKHQLQNEHRFELDELRRELTSSMYTKDYVDTVVQHKVDEKLLQLQKTYVAPLQHESVVKSKTEQVESRMRLEYEREINEREQKHRQHIQQLETQQLLKCDELKIRLENDYSSSLDALKRQLQLYEQQIERERKNNRDWESNKSQLEQQIQQQSQQYQELKHQLNAAKDSEARLTAHIQAQNAVIDKLKLLIEQEKQRVNELPEKDKQAYLHMLEDVEDRFALEKRLLITSHDNERAGFQLAIAQEKKVYNIVKQQFDELQSNIQASQQTIMTSSQQQLDILQLQHQATVESIQEINLQKWNERESEWKKEMSERESLIEKKVSEWETRYEREIQQKNKELSDAQSMLTHVSQLLENLQVQHQTLTRQYTDLHAANLDYEQRNVVLHDTAQRLRAIMQAMIIKYRGIVQQLQLLQSSHTILRDQTTHDLQQLHQVAHDSIISLKSFSSASLQHASLFSARSTDESVRKIQDKYETHINDMRTNFNRQEAQAHAELRQQYQTIDALKKESADELLKLQTQHNAALTTQRASFDELNGKYQSLDEEHKKTREKWNISIAELADANKQYTELQQAYNQLHFDKKSQSIEHELELKNAQQQYDSALSQHSQKFEMDKQQLLTQLQQTQAKLDQSVLSQQEKDQVIDKLQRELESVHEKYANTKYDKEALINDKMEMIREHEKLELQLESVQSRLRDMQEMQRASEEKLVSSQTQHTMELQNLVQTHSLQMKQLEKDIQTKEKTHDQQIENYKQLTNELRLSIEKQKSDIQLLNSQLSTLKQESQTSLEQQRSKVLSSVVEDEERKRDALNNSWKLRFAEKEAVIAQLNDHIASIEKQARMTSYEKADCEKEIFSLKSQIELLTIEKQRYEVDIQELHHLHANSHQQLRGNAQLVINESEEKAIRDAEKYRQVIKDKQDIIMQKDIELKQLHDQLDRKQEQMITLMNVLSQLIPIPSDIQAGLIQHSSLLSAAGNLSTSTLPFVDALRQLQAVVTSYIDSLKAATSQSTAQYEQINNQFNGERLSWSNKEIELEQEIRRLKLLLDNRNIGAGTFNTQISIEPIDSSVKQPLTASSISISPSATMPTLPTTTQFTFNSQSPLSSPLTFSPSRRTVSSQPTLTFNSQLFDSDSSFRQASQLFADRERVRVQELNANEEKVKSQKNQLQGLLQRVQRTMKYDSSTSNESSLNSSLNTSLNNSSRY